MPDQSLLNLSFPESDIACITLDAPGKSVNVLSSDVLEELGKMLDDLAGRDDLKGLVLISAKDSFIAGADLREFVQSIDADKQDVIAISRRGQQLFARLAELPLVSVAAIGGLCLGGGAELAMWCDYRVMSDDPQTQYGFPEVKLGLFPGWGGTARLPRMVGLGNAVELITGGESIDAEAAYELGLAWNVVPRDHLLSSAITLIREQHEKRDYLRQRERWAGEIEMSPMELSFLGATASAYIQQQTKGHYPAPVEALELMLGATEVDLETACERESAAFAELFGSPVNRALLNVFFLQDANKKDPGIADGEQQPREIRAVSVIGAGVMGQGIAAANARRRVPVTITDANTEALAAGVSKILQEVSYNKQIKGPDVEKAVAMAPLINGSTAASEVAASDLVIEAVVENPGIKQQVYEQLEKDLADDAIIASNTSTIPISKLSEKLNRPERFCGMHFFNPVRKMPLVEVIRGEKTSDATVATVVAHAKRIGKSPIVVGDGPGFLVNRVLLPYMTEAAELLREGASIRHVEKAAKAFGMPMGPITLFDVVGIDVAVHAGEVMQAAFGDRVIDAPLLTAMYEAGRLGQKSGRGFFDYSGKKGKAQPDPEVDTLIAEHRQAQQDFTPEQLTHRLFLPMLLEATRILEEKLVRSARDVDLALIYGIGFPPFKGGLLFWADTVGARTLLQWLKPLRQLGTRYEPTEMLEQMAEEDKTFYTPSLAR